MYKVTFVSSIFAPDGKINEAQATLQLYLDTLVRANCILMARRDFPILRELRPKYTPNFGTWQDAIQLADCRMGAPHDLAAYRVAELRKQGVDARAQLFLQESGRRYECRVQYPSNAPRHLVNPLAFAMGNGTIIERPDVDADSKGLPIVNTTYPLESNFVSSLFAQDGADRSESHSTLQSYLDTLVGANRILRRSRKLPLLYDDGVRYEAEPAGEENWLDTLIVRKKKRADCEDLAGDRTAEVADTGAFEPRAVFEFYQNPNTLQQVYHCKSRYGVPMGGGPRMHPSARALGNGMYLEDPSKILGMHGAY